MSSAPTEEEWSWVSADGHLRSGSRDELMRSYAEGRLPAQNPVKKNDWSDWISVGELVAPPTEPYNAAPSFEDTLSTRKQRTLVMRTDSTMDDVTVPRGMPALSAPQAQRIIEIIPAPAPAPAAPARKSRLGLVLAVGAVLVAATLVIVLGVLFVLRSRPEANLPAPVTTPTPTASVTPPPAEPQPPSACRASGEPVRLLAIVPPGATLHLGTREGKLAVGVPTSERGGVGLTVDPRTLGLLETTPFADSARVAGVVPNGAGFSVDRFATRVPGSDFSLGMTPNGLSRLGDDASQSVVWAGEAALPITRPAITHVSGVGYAVAFRRGEADVRAGWIDERGAKKSELVRLTSEALKSSAPAIASAAERVVVAFSAVDSSSTSRIVLADLSPKLRTLPTSGENPRAPAIQPFGKDRFLVAWLEGDAASGRSLHARMLKPDLVTAGTDAMLAKLTRPVESIALWQHEGRAVVLLSERAADSRNELFALRLECH